MLNALLLVRFLLPKKVVFYDMITFEIVELTPNQPYLVVGGGTVKPQML